MSLESVAGQLATIERRIVALQAKERPLTLRGWQDDFFGNQLKDEYTISLLGGIAALVDGKHGGWVRLNGTTIANQYAVIALGAVGGAPNYDTLDRDEGWEIIWRMELHGVTNIQAGALGFEWLNQDRIFCGLRTDIHATNWIIRCWDAPATSFTDTGVAADTDPHVHRMIVYPTLTGHQVDYFLDGTEIGSHTTDIPAGFLQPMLWCVNRGGSGTDRISDFDAWKVIPKNL